MTKPTDVCVVEAPEADTMPDATGVLGIPMRGAVSGTLVGFADGGAPLVEVAIGSTCSRFVARSCITLEVRDLWKRLVLVFDENNPDTPFVVGMLRPTGERTPKAKPTITPMPREIEVDGRTLVLSAQESITLQCGDASITLRRDGRVVVRGTHIVSHAAGVNRIRGGSVQLN